MKIIFGILFFLVIINAKNIYYFAPLALEKTESNLKQYEELIDHLREKTGLDIKVKYFPKYEDILVAFEEGEVDFTHLGALPFIELSKRFPDAQSIASFRDSQARSGYKCCLIARKDSSFSNSTNLLSVQNVALTQPLSTCGFLMTSEILKKHNINLSKLDYRYFGSHSNVALSVILGDSDIGGIKCDIASRYLFHSLTIVDRSRTLPQFSFVINNKTVDKETKEQIKQALLDIENLDSTELKNWSEQIKYGVFEVDDADYDHLRDVVNRVKIPHESK
ncbi:MAG: PhnD/SsuA/transferrin family substrate-binding protein [Campylobacterales bacterium]